MQIYIIKFNRKIYNNLRKELNNNFTTFAFERYYVLFVCCSAKDLEWNESLRSLIYICVLLAQFALYCFPAEQVRLEVRIRN